MRGSAAVEVFAAFPRSPATDAGNDCCFARTIRDFFPANAADPFRVKTSSAGNQTIVGPRRQHNSEQTIRHVTNERQRDSVIHQERTLR